MGDVVKISVHAVIGETGFLVKVVAAGRCQKFPVPTQEEGAEMALAIRDYVTAGLPIDVLMAGASEETE